MSRRLLAALVASVAVAGAVVVSVSALQPGESLVRQRADGTGAQTFAATAGTECWRNGVWVIRPQSVPLSACTAPTTTTTTVPPPTTTTPPPATTTPPAMGGFVETFVGNAGLERFDHGVFHRDDSFNINGTVGGDHDLNCGDPSTQRTVYAADPSSSFYVCADHLMTAIGDWSGYSTGWFEPRQTFTTERTVSWDVNITDLGGRQWFEVAILPASFESGIPSCPHCVAMDWIAPVAHLPAYPAGSIVVGNGPGGGDIRVSTNGVDRGVREFYKTCDFDPQGCGSKTIRRPFSIHDNGNGTVTVNYAGFGTYTVPGSFPAEFRVVLKDHNYTPDKDGTPIGHTWHWDNIAIK